ncbi:uncharacterized protein LOC141817665 [Curcuma longa]|uniref:uncharacterized protein LOC141817665 n=1 Tax=Curcuma longa TaxID=136217 RepID=UPI003D9DE986
MSYVEGHSTVRPPLFNGDDFVYWRSRMEYYLKTQVQTWIIIKTGFTLPTDDKGIPVSIDKWTPEIMRAIEADAKATQILQCGLSKEELNRVGPFISAKDLWDKLIELHEGTTDTKVTKRDLLINKLFNIKMQEGETVNQLQSRVKDILNGLHAIGQKIENRDIIRYVLNSFPRTTSWMSLVDAYRISKDLSTVKLDDLFSEFELYEQINSGQTEKGIALIAGKTKNKERKAKVQPEPESDDDSSDDDEDLTEIVNLVRRMVKKKRFNKKELKSIIQGKGQRSSRPISEVTCYGCQQKGHYRHKCPNLKESKKPKKKKALKATWDESSSESDGEDTQQTSYLALMANHHESESEAESESSHGSASESDDETEVSPALVNRLYDIITVLSKKLDKSKDKVKSLRKEVEDLKKVTEPSSPADQVQVRTSTQVEKLEEENSNLKHQVEELTGSLEQFTTSSKYLKMMLGNQRAVHNGAGLGFKTKKRFTSFISLTNRSSIRQAWVPKQCLHVKNNSNFYWVPKGKVHYLDRPYQGNDPGGSNRKTIHVT